MNTYICDNCGCEVTVEPDGNEGFIESVSGGLHRCNVIVNAKDYIGERLAGKLEEEARRAEFQGYCASKGIRKGG